MIPNLGANRFELAAKEGFGDIKFGRNPSVGSTYETVWTAGGLYPWPAAADTTEVVSSDASDTMTVVLFGTLDDYTAVQIPVVLNGTTPVATTANLFRCFRIRILGDVEPAGDIEVSIGGTKVAEILQGRNTTEMMVFTVPKGVTLYLTDVFGSTDGNKGTTFELWSRPQGGIFHNRSHFYIPPEKGSYTKSLTPYSRFDEGTDLEVRASADQTGQVSADGGGIFFPKLEFEPTL